MPARGEPLPPPFRLYISPSRPATYLPGCASLGNTRGHRRQGRSSTGASAPLLSLLSVCSAGREKEAEEGRKEEEEREKKKKRQITDRS
ncbi:Os09g0269500 [Oryza sativa Japonica Group]|uniref:Os09g0269500 protein n=1 Tax=Oryza sativa subsp. japonica TaxID=39947 RepID=C7J6L2_ORYSJ|nr:Os09g0269500 [Oryza sativa Japonica Group]|eukprot:NP_001175743.1 Os09g0269500 [Oryza sativa Japonica Group]